MKNIKKLVVLAAVALTGIVIPVGVKTALAAPPPVDIYISNCQELADLNNNQAVNASKKIELINNIDCTGVNFSPLFPEQPFTGGFDGKNFTISNITVNTPSEHNVGLFARLGAGVWVERFKLIDSSFIGQYNVGSIAGSTETTSNNRLVLNDIYSSASVTATDSSYGYNVGGIIGEQVGNVEFTWITYTGSVEGRHKVGGLIGEVTQPAFGYTQIDETAVTGSVTGVDSVGGMVGYFAQDGPTQSYLLIVRSYFDGTAEGTASSAVDAVGGFVGVIEQGISSSNAMTAIQYSYAAGSITGNKTAGLVGTYNRINSTLQLNATFSVATQHATSVSAGLVHDLPDVSDANTGVTSSDNYFDVTRSGTSTCTTATTDLDNCTGVNVASSSPNYFFNNHAVAPLTSWDFYSVWQDNAGTAPRLLHSFTSANNDVDGDGIDSAIENNGPNNGDSNGDGQFDGRQAHVGSFKGVGGKYVTLELNNTCSIVSASASAEGGGASADVTYSYPGGLATFSADCVTPGATADVTLYFHGVTDEDEFVVRKYDPTSHAYTTIEDAAIETVQIGGEDATKVTYQVKDGGPLDQDGAENGAIEDPVGLGLLMPVTTDTNSNGSTNTSSDSSNSKSDSLVNTGLNIVLILSLVAVLISAATVIHRRHVGSPDAQ